MFGVVGRKAGELLTYRGHEGARDDDGAAGDGNVDGSNAIHHFAQLNLARDLEPALVVRSDAIDILTQDQKVAFSVAFEEGVFIDRSHGRTPPRLEVAGDFRECVGFAFLPTFILED